MKISKEQVEHMAQLARLELSEDDKEKFSKEFSDILDYVEQLNEVDPPSPRLRRAGTSKVESGRGYLVDPSTSSGQESEQVNKLREDKVSREEGESVRDKFVPLAPGHDKDFIRTISPLK